MSSFGAARKKGKKALKKFKILKKKSLENMLVVVTATGQ